jgi:hypothetical protein
MDRMKRKSQRFQPTRCGQFIGKDAPFDTREEAEAEIERDKTWQRKALADEWIDQEGFDGTWWDIVTVRR